MVAETEGETVAVALSLPDFNQVLKKMDGRLLPLGWSHFLRCGRKHRPGARRVPRRQADLAAHRGRREALREHFDTATRTPQKWGEMGWILETNKNMNRAMEAMGGRIVRRFRVYERAPKG